MKKLITILFLTLLINFTQAQVLTSYCNKTCNNALRIPTDLDGGVYQWTDSAMIGWTDPDANGYCSWGYNNPTYTGYQINVWKDGILIIEQKNYSKLWNTPFTTVGNYAYFFKCPAGSDYSWQVCKQCNDGTLTCSAVKAFTTKAIAPIVPAGTNLTGGKVKGKK